MKKVIFSFTVAILLAANIWAQAPQSFNYQAVVRNSSGAVVANQAVSVRFTVLDGSSTGTPVYQETQSLTTNQFGLITTAVGTGTVVSGMFPAIQWGGGAKYLQVEVDETGGTNYVSLGASQLLSVPYALYSSATAGGSPWTISSNNIFNANSGNVGIGVSSPTAKLDIAGGNWGIGNSADLQIGDATHSFRIGIATSGSGAGDVYIGAVGGTNRLFLGGSTNSDTLQTLTVAGGNVGIGNIYPGAKLDIAGQIKIADGTQGAGKVLTSDANGLASWQTPSSGSGVGFSAKGAGVTSVPSSSLTQLSFTTEDFDDGNGFSTNQYVAPSAGVYHFDAQVFWSSFSSNTGWTELVIYVNGNQYQESDSKAVTTQTYTSNLVSANIKLNTGDIVDVRAYQASGATVTIPAFSLDQRFSGYKVY